MQAIIPPREPQEHEPVQPPMVYLEKQLKWEYKQIVRNLESEKPPDEAELNTLGKEGWELTGMIQQAPAAYFYFNRQSEK
jgi:hypothetical protein